MKMMKRMLAMMLSAVLIAMMLCVGVCAEERTVTSVTTDDLTLYQYGDGDTVAIETDGTYITESWFRYDITPKTYTVTFSDGSTFTGSPYEVYQQTGDWAQLHDDQSATNEWGPGEHTVTFTFGEVTGSYIVTVIEAPVVSVTAEPLVLRQYIDGDWGQDGCFHYTIDPVLTVTLTDGRIATGTRWEIQKQTGYLPRPHSSQMHGAEWGVGEYTASMTYMGVEATFLVTVEDVVNAIELVQLPDRTARIPYGTYTDLNGGILRVQFADGSHEDIPLDTQPHSPQYTSQTLNGTFDMDVTPPRMTVVGEQEVSLRFLGETVSYTMQVMSPPESLTLTANEDHSLIMTFGFADEAISYSITDFAFSTGMSSSNGDIEARGTLYTTDGMFYAALIKDGVTGTVSVALGSEYMDGGVYAVSNSITDTVWFNEHNGMFVRGDFNEDGEANTADVRGILTMLDDYTYYNDFQCIAADLNNNGTIDTTDARAILKRMV